MRAAALLLLLALSLAGVAHAQKPLGLELYKQGVELVQRGEFRQAIAAFERSLAAYPHDNTLYALGEAHRRAGQLRHSFRYYSRYAERLQGAEREAFLAKLRRLREEAVSRLTVATEPEGATIWLDGRLVGTTAVPLRLELRAGAHRLRAALPGYAELEQPVSAEFGEPVTLNLSLVARASPRPAPGPAEPPPPRRRGGWFVGLGAGPALAGYGLSSLSVSASLDAALELGYLIRFGRIALTFGLLVEAVPVTDRIADDVAAFISLLPGVGARVILRGGLWLELRAGLGLGLLAGAGPQSFLVRGAPDARDLYLGLVLQPALRLGWSFWRGAALVLTPAALDYSPRSAGFADLAPGLGAIWRYHAALGLAWTFGDAGGR